MQPQTDGVDLAFAFEVDPSVDYVGGEHAAPLEKGAVDQYGRNEMSEHSGFAITLEQQQDYQFEASFDWDQAADLLVDSGEPLGQGEGPDSERLLAVAVGYCLTASLLFSMRKFRQNAGALRAEVSGTFTRNERGRLRVGGLEVTIRLSDPVDRIAHFERSAQQFEDFCTVTESIRQGIPVRVKVVDATGQSVHESSSR